jgi:S-adenosylmethionine-diacylglycerol 3-amino-3-carboxypropyl transferase
MSAPAQLPGVRYAQCWEDPQTLSEALAIAPDDAVISIASGGDNSFALLLNNPKTLTLIDGNPAQIFLVELKIQAIQNFDYDDFVSFLGARPCHARRRLYGRLRFALSDAGRGFWDRRTEDIERGIIHCGKFERYLSMARRYVLPLIHGEKVVAALLGPSSLDEQRDFFNLVWNNRRWRWLFRLLFGRFLLARLGRDPSCFQYVTTNHIAEELLARTRRGLTEIPVRDNFFLEYIFTGGYHDLETASPYLRKSNFAFLKQNVGRMRLFTGSLEQYLATVEPGAAAKFNLSDIFEYMPVSAVERTLREMLHIVRHAGRMAFWTLFVPRRVPTALSDRIRSSVIDSATYSLSDRGFFYDSFAVWDIGPTMPVGAGASVWRSEDR